MPLRASEHSGPVHQCGQPLVSGAFTDSNSVLAVSEIRFLERAYNRDERSIDVSCHLSRSERRGAASDPRKANGRRKIVTSIIELSGCAERGVRSDGEPVLGLCCPKYPCTAHSRATMK